MANQFGGKSLTGEELEMELKKYNKMQNKIKTRICYPTIPTVEQVVKDLESVEEVLIRLDDKTMVKTSKLTTLTTTTYIIKLNDATIAVHGTSNKTEPTRREEVDYYDSKNDDTIPRTTVRFCGEQQFKNILSNIIGK